MVYLEITFGGLLLEEPLTKVENEDNQFAKVIKYKLTLA